MEYQPRYLFSPCESAHITETATRQPITGIVIIIRYLNKRNINDISVIIKLRIFETAAYTRISESVWNSWRWRSSDSQIRGSTSLKKRNERSVP